MIRTDEIVERRGLLRRRLVRWVIVAVAAGFAMSPWFLSAVLPEPDPYRVLLGELASAHFRATSTSTVVKEYSDLRGLFVDEYRKRNARRGLAPVDLPAPGDLWSYSYVPGGNDITAYTYADLASTSERPTMVVTDPSDPPFVVWIYSKEQNGLAVFVFERFVHDVFEGKPPTPDPRMFLDYDSGGTIASYGPAPKERLIYVHAWLLSLGGHDARTLLYGERISQADVLNLIPVVVKVSAREEFIPPVFAGTPLDRARETVRRPTRYVRIALLLLVAVAAILAARAMVSLVRLRREFTQVASMGLGAFLFGDPESIARREREESRAAAIASAAKRREEAERVTLLTEIATLIDCPCEDLSNDELRELRNRLVAEAAERSEEEVRALLIVQEREREIHRLEVELGTIPIEAASDEAHDARPSWELLQQALSETELRERLELLKEARRLLPKEYRPDRF